MVEKRLGYPIVIVEDRYGGVYSKGKWIAIAEGEKNILEKGASGGWDDGDVECGMFWERVADEDWIAVGRDPNEALANLLAKGWTL